jgi:hypothetical protein
MALKSVQLEVLTGPQGGGKSEAMRKETIQNGGLYLFALPIKELIDEQSADFFRDAPTLHTVKVYSEPGKSATGKRLDAARKDIESRGLTDAVIFTTHATLMEHPLEGFENWHARVDEAPGAVQAGKFNIAVSLRRWFNETFSLHGGDEYEWSAVSLKIEKPNWKAVEQDTGAKPLVEFIKQAAQPERVFVKANTWDERDEFEWFSMWSPLALANFKTIQVAGSSYTESVGFQAAKSLYGELLGVQFREIRPQRTGQPDIKIHFFTRGHDGTTAFWKGHEGLRSLVPVTDFLASKLPPDSFWSGNKIVETVMMGRLKAQFIQPMAAGLNKFRASNSCAIIFSAKATPADKPLIEVFGLSEQDIERARETEAIRQFAMRGAIRNSDYAGPYDIYVHTEKQAERLKEFLTEIDFTTIEIVAVDEAEIMDLARPKTERNKLTEKEKADRAEARRAKDTARKRSERETKRTQQGLPKRGRGRPKTPPK